MSGRGLVLFHAVLMKYWPDAEWKMLCSPHNHNPWNHSPCAPSKPLYHSVLWCKKEAEADRSACRPRFKPRFMCIIQFGYIFKSTAKWKLPEPLWAIDSHQRKLCLFYSLDFNHTLTLAALTLKAVTFRPPKCLTLISYWACASCKNESNIKQWKYDSYESPASSYNCSCQAIKDHGVYCIAANTVSRNWRTNHWRVIAPMF